MIRRITTTAPPAATIFTLAIIMSISTIAAPATATTSNDATTTTSASGAIELSPQPVLQQRTTTTSMIPINQTHSIATFIGNGTLTVPNTGETINMTNNGTAIITPLTESGETVSAYGKENVFSEDGDTSAIAFYEIVRYNPTTLQGKGLTIAVFDANATGSLAPFNGMMIVGTHEEDPNTRTATFTLWEWKSGIPLPTSTPTTMEEPPLMNMTTTATNATAADTNATVTAEEEVPTTSLDIF